MANDKVLEVSQSADRNSGHTKLLFSPHSCVSVPLLTLLSPLECSFSLVCLENSPNIPNVTSCDTSSLKPSFSSLDPSLLCASWWLVSTSIVMLPLTDSLLRVRHNAKYFSQTYDLIVTLQVIPDYTKTKNFTNMTWLAQGLVVRKWRPRFESWYVSLRHLCGFSNVKLFYFFLISYTIRNSRTKMSFTPMMPGK